MLDQGKYAGLKFEPHVSKCLTNGVTAPINKSRRHIFRLKNPLHRPLSIDKKPTSVHRSVKQRWDADPGYRPQKLVTLVDKHGWRTILEKD